VEKADLQKDLGNWGFGLLGKTKVNPKKSMGKTKREGGGKPMSNGKRLSYLKKAGVFTRATVKKRHQGGREVFLMPWKKKKPYVAGWEKSHEKPGGGTGGMGWKSQGVGQFLLGGKGYSKKYKIML